MAMAVSKFYNNVKPQVEVASGQAVKFFTPENKKSSIVLTSIGCIFCAKFRSLKQFNLPQFSDVFSEHIIVARRRTG